MGLIDSMADFYEEHETACNIAMFGVGIAIGVGAGIYISKKLTYKNNLVIPKTSDVGCIVSGIKGDLISGRIKYFDIVDTSIGTSIGAGLVETDKLPLTNNIDFSFKGVNSSVTSFKPIPVKTAAAK